MASTEKIVSGVDHPSHYNIPGKKECIVQMQEDYGRLFVYFFDCGNGYKYFYRAGFKESESCDKDLEKAKWYASHSNEIKRSWTWFQRLVMRMAQRICF